MLIANGIIANATNCSVDTPANKAKINVNPATNNFSFPSKNLAKLLVNLSYAFSDPVSYTHLTLPTKA